MQAIITIMEVIVAAIVFVADRRKNRQCARFKKKYLRTFKIEYN